MSDIDPKMVRLLADQEEMLEAFDKLVRPIMDMMIRSRDSAVTSEQQGEIYRAAKRSGLPVGPGDMSPGLRKFAELLEAPDGSVIKMDNPGGVCFTSKAPCDPIVSIVNLSLDLKDLTKRIERLEKFPRLIDFGGKKVMAIPCESEKGVLNSPRTPDKLRDCLSSKP